MKKIITIAAAAIALSGCGKMAYDSTPVTEGYKVKISPVEIVYLTIWTDPVTGCESYVTDEGFVSPRLKADGAQRCVEIRQ